VDLNFLTIREALKGLKAKEFSSVELVRASLDQIRKYNDELNVFLTVDEEGALEQARMVDKGRQKGLLAGVPVALKDLYITEGLRTTAGSKVLEDYVPQYEATVVKRLKEEGAIVIGKLNEDAWGHGASGENSDFGPTKNPWDLTRVAGGSSSGSGAAVAAGMCLAAGGTDTGGSIRAPSAFCGVTGLKPTYGRVSRYGIIAMASSLDSIGHTAKSVWDVAAYLEVSAGLDAYDSTTASVQVPKYVEDLKRFKLAADQLVVGVPVEYFAQGVDVEVRKAVWSAVKLLEEYGARIVEVSLPHTDYGVATYYIIQPSEVSSNLARYDGIRYGFARKTFGDEAKRRIMIGTYCLSTGYYDAYYKKAMQVRTLIKQDFDKVFGKVDMLVAPVMPTPAFLIGEKQSPLEMYLADVYTAPANLAGIPALAFPCGFSSEGMPIGMQLLGPQYSEGLLLKVGHWYQQLTDWHTRKPRLS
jgi:aspartyl-tRNA(Asn)/glutamyl-tRNA(Gln) amidotransferase subunit A